MHKLSVAVAAFAGLALFFAIKLGETEFYLLAAGAALCAYTTWRSVGVSSFLKIFVGMFSTETILFGLASIADAAHLLPPLASEFAPSAIMALTVAVFSVFSFAVSHFPLVRQMTRIADHYFDSDDRAELRFWRFPAVTMRETTFAIAIIIVLIALNQSVVGISVRLSFIRRDYYSALQDLNAAVFWNKMLWGFVPWAFVHVGVAILDYVLQSYMILRWRRWLTQHYVDRWLGGHRHYTMTLAGADADNPDQRISEDVNRFIDGGTDGYGIYSYSILLISTLSSLVSYSIVLWDISSQLNVLPNGGTVPGLLFWVALVYAAIGTAVTHWIGRPLVKLNFQRQKREADFRFSLARLREYGEQIALLSGEAAEQRSLGRKFGAVYDNVLAIINLRKRLTSFTATYGQVSPILPFVLTAPFVLSGKIKIGVIRQTADAFGVVEDALNFFVRYYTYLADFRAVLDRLETFDAAADAAAGLSAAAAARLGAAKDDALTLNARLALPNGRVIVETKDLVLAKGQSTLLSGPSGSGKSTLFRAIAGVWPYGGGAIAAPKDAKRMLLPQRPYIPQGALRAAVAYPSDADAFSREAIEAALQAARLAPFVARLDDENGWAQRLSGGEQQRVAIARALLAKPDWLFLDEATSALDEKLEAEIYAMLAEKLPGATIVSIGHRSTLEAFHQRHLEMTLGADGLYAPRDKVLA
jgi:vitamin B12/bleomycin/antimicrobial peptide transport system ATP-binding/permease protein